jgi:hypothetical protein
MEQIELTAVEVDIPDEPFEIKVTKIRSALAWTFSYLREAEVHVTDGEKLAKFIVGPYDYDLDSGCTLTDPIPVSEVGDVRALIDEVTKSAPSSYRNPVTSKGIVPLDAEVERLLQAHPGIELKIEGVGMPYGQGKRVNYYSGKIGV